MTITRRQLLVGSTTGVVGLSVASLARAQTAPAPTPKQVYFDPGNPVLGNPKGDVTIAEFFDFQCPYCKHDFPTVRDVVKKDGKVRLVMKDWPIFGPTSVYAAHLALGARKLGKYEQVLDALMATLARLSEDDVRQALTRAGLDVGKLEKAYSDNKSEIDAALKRNNELADAFGFPGTPSYVIGRSVYGGVLDRDALETAIAKARKPA